jgi:hypothetical protein
VGAFAVESGYSFLVLEQPGWGAEKLVVAAVLLVAMSRPLRRRREPLLLAVPVIALGAAGHLALDGVLALAG